MNAHRDRVGEINEESVQSVPRGAKSQRLVRQGCAVRPEGVPIKHGDEPFPRLLELLPQAVEHLEIIQKVAPWLANLAGVKSGYLVPESLFLPRRGSWKTPQAACRLRSASQAAVP